MRVRAFLLLLLLFVAEASADQFLRVAVASSFLETAAGLADVFRSETGIEVRISSGSTGHLYAQIVNGAPYDVFLAADTERPRRLEAAGRAVAGSRFTYAIGALVVWSWTARDCLAALSDPEAGRIAIANPDTAPYGQAAREFLVSIDAWDTARPRLVYGRSAAQALHFAATRNVPIAILPLAYASNPAVADATCAEEVPQSSHSPLDQQLVLLDADSDAARRFVNFLRGTSARDLIARHGYATPL